jgi:superoxide dismutase, Fe-Mn family
MSKYSLPDLPYDYAALEPHISASIMELHHDKHHKAYVDGANQTLEQLNEAQKKEDFAQVGWLERKLAFNASGHVLHSIFWQNLTPKGGGEPQESSPLGQALKRDFGGFGIFKKQLTAAAAQTMGSGWAALTWNPLRQCLETSLIHDHQSDVVQAGVPLLVIDAWEHAFYLQYRTDKAKYFGALWNVFNWDDVSKRLQGAQKLDLGLNKAVAG